MGLKDSWNKVKGYLSGHQDDELYEDELYEDEEVAAPPVRPVAGSHATHATTSAQQARSLKMMVIEPKAFEDAQGIANHLRDRKPVVLNFETTDEDVAKRIVDFISGTTYALDGSIQKVGKEIFLCVPSNVSVDRENRTYTDFTPDALVWKERN